MYTIDFFSKFGGGGGGGGRHCPPKPMNGSVPGCDHGL